MIKSLAISVVYLIAITIIIISVNKLIKLNKNTKMVSKTSVHNFAKLIAVKYPNESKMLLRVKTISKIFIALFFISYIAFLVLFVLRQLDLIISLQIIPICLIVSIFLSIIQIIQYRLSSNVTNDYLEKNNVKNNVDILNSLMLDKQYAITWIFINIAFIFFPISVYFLDWSSYILIKNFKNLIFNLNRI